MRRRQVFAAAAVADGLRAGEAVIRARGDVPLDEPGATITADASFFEQMGQVLVEKRKPGWPKGRPRKVPA